jgi:hypothetical protein
MLECLPGAQVGGASSLGELEDLEVRAGSFLNAGAGWNTYSFHDVWDAAPIVYAHCDGYSVEVKSVTESKFLYRVYSGSTNASSTELIVHWMACEYNGG